MQPSLALEASDSEDSHYSGLESEPDTEEEEEVGWSTLLACVCVGRNVGIEQPTLVRSTVALFSTRCWVLGLKMGGQRSALTRKSSLMTLGGRRKTQTRLMKK